MMAFIGGVIAGLAWGGVLTYIVMDKKLQAMRQGRMEAMQGWMKLLQTHMDVRQELRSFHKHVGQKSPIQL